MLEDGVPAATQRAQLGARRSVFTPYKQLEDKTVTTMLQEMVKTLDPPEATILRYRFGLDGGSEKRKLSSRMRQSASDTCESPS